MITIRNFSENDQPHFEALNRNWIETYFWMEAFDEWVLTQPYKAILEPGGAILIAEYDGKVAGTVALRKINGDTYEFTKMAVDPAFQRKGIAASLSNAAFNTVRQLGGNHVILYSQTGLSAAIRLYRRLGFKEIPLDAGTLYKRSDIKMEIYLDMKSN